jgi:hypothetical protein
MHALQAKVERIQDIHDHGAVAPRQLLTATKVFHTGSSPQLVTVLRVALSTRIVPNHAWWRSLKAMIFDAS